MTKDGSVDESASALSTILPLLACPACGLDAVLEAQQNKLVCGECATPFPVTSHNSIDIPWLFPEPESARLEWKARYNGFMHSNAAEQERLQKALSESQNSTPAQRRISALLHAREHHRGQVAELLAPLALDDIDWPQDAANLLSSKLPKNQGLTSYTNNIYRDWVWENGENESLFNAVSKVLSADPRENIGMTLTLGAGACRLPYDMHTSLSATTSVVLDLNPLLLQVASRVIQGQSLSLYEFPIAPLNEASFAVQQVCRAPAKLKNENFHFLLGDAMNLPFGKNSFDTIVTPWFIDIIPQNLRDYIPRINCALQEDGVWVNTGSLAFFHKDETWCYSEEEVLELVEKNGFKLLDVDRRTVSYLQSPLSAHGRTESILSFSAKKIADVAAPEHYSYLPEWLLNTAIPIPPSADMAVESSSHLLTAQVLALIDGRRTINQIGTLVANQYGLGTPESVHAVKRILADTWEQSGNAGLNWGD